MDSMKAILLIDHGSTRAEANEMLEDMAIVVRRVAGPDVIVHAAHMELAEPTIADSFARCVREGATEIIAFPYMLSPGRHSTKDIPNLVREAAAAYPGVTYRVTGAFGISEKLAGVVLERAGVEQAASSDAEITDASADSAALAR